MRNVATECFSRSLACTSTDVGAPGIARSPDAFFASGANSCQYSLCMEVKFGYGLSVRLVAPRTRMRQPSNGGDNVPTTWGPSAPGKLFTSTSDWSPFELDGYRGSDCARSIGTNGSSQISAFGEPSLRRRLWASSFHHCSAVFKAGNRHSRTKRYGCIALDTSSSETSTSGRPLIDTVTVGSKLPMLVE
jgi:hypothetical protein